jgi:Putative peptidoglycan binding domain
MVALGASVLTDPTEPQCPTGGVRERGAPLAHWNMRCANVAVPLTADIIARAQAARVAVGVQRALIALGYDAGPLGAIDEPRALAAIKQVQRDMGWPVTGEPTDALRKILCLKTPTS